MCDERRVLARDNDFSCLVSLRPDLLTGLNVEIQAGETVAIIGENGAGNLDPGKWTFLKPLDTDFV